MTKIRGKKPTRNVKILLSSKGLRADKWLVIRTYQEKLTLVHKDTGTLKNVLIH
ncbi:DUF6906 family protein [Carnobacterium divergens]|uniref:DUF6906 family protein n=1 Tax=Carnobacterium divergens TaxID=2748 RepID=UPI00289037E6|nr:hypothetical protein [Carnobacterium divergens]MDT2010810.1 hypothetical protein [Carnobacterium divergens]